MAQSVPAPPSVNVSRPRAAPPPLPAHVREVADAVRMELWFGDADPRHADLEASRSMAAAAAKAAGLKPFPEVAQRALGLLADVEAPAAKIARVVAEDTALAAGLLRVANSALYRPTTPIASVQDAVVRLGLGTVREIVAAVATMGLFADASGLAHAIRNHSAAVAALARVFGTEWGAKGVDGIFLAGLIHDVGKLLTMQVKELDYATLAPETRSKPDECHVHERALLGYDHAVLGAQVLTHWKLQTELSQVVAWHHQPGRAYAAGGIVGLSVALVRLSDQLEYKLAESIEPDPAFCEALAMEGAAAYAGFSAHHLIAMWPKLVLVREEALASFGVHRK